MFRDAYAFNQNISSWNTAAVTNMMDMFRSATAFNQPLVHSGNTWNLGNVTSMDRMFAYATSFTTNNYDIFLYSQANNPGIESNITIDVSSKYCDSTSRTFLTGTKNWTINDSGASSDCNKFVSTWAVSSGSFELPLKDYTNITIDWGDGSTTTHTGGAMQSHSYSAAGTYTITVTVNDASTKDIGEMYMNGDHASRTLIRTITNWGEGKWETFYAAFKGATNLTIPATDEPDLSLTTDMGGAFRDCTSLVGTTLNDWNTATVTEMNNMFFGATSFNGNIGSWNTAIVTNMQSMFYGATSFNQNINTSGSSWNTAAVTRYGLYVLWCNCF